MTSTRIVSAASCRRREHVAPLLFDAFSIEPEGPGAHRGATCRDGDVRRSDEGHAQPRAAVAAF